MATVVRWQLQQRPLSFLHGVHRERVAEGRVRGQNSWLCCNLLNILTLLSEGVYVSRNVHGLFRGWFVRIL